MQFLQRLQLGWSPMFSCFSCRTSQNYPFLLGVFYSLSLWFSKYSLNNHSHYSMCSGLCVKGQPQLIVARHRIQSAVDKLFPQLILDNHNSLSREYPSHLLEPKRLTDLLGSGGLNTWGLCCNPGFLTCSSASFSITLYSQDTPGSVQLHLQICRLKRHNLA